ncbi:TolC family protein [Albirhodobacter sp. R86504]|jgi:adhesin transport system outer membrane protein|uniref:TolC family protein n=1 Tax=Albirhodobacter sp. R86504 TaxID=3093848 RepID=UPI0036713DD0
MTRRDLKDFPRATSAVRFGTAACFALVLTGCGWGEEDSSLASMQSFQPAGADAALVPATPGVTAETSVVISDLKLRRSVLPSGGAYQQVGQSVLAASRGKAEAELRVARLTAEARSKNWLPQLTPSISLSSLGDLVTSLVVEQVLFDNGKKKAERAFAAADVEVAAVNYAAEMNDRVSDGLEHYIAAKRAIEQGAAARDATVRMKEYNRIMLERVKGGLSDMSEARVISQKYAEMEATARSDDDSRTTALAQLNAMADRDLSTVTGVDQLFVQTLEAKPLTVVMAEAERGRSLAEAKIMRAGYLPGISAVGEVGSGASEFGLSATVGNALGFGTGDALAAIEATKASADAAVSEAQQDAQITRVTMERKLEAARAKYVRDAEVIRQTGEGLDLFVEQYKVGRRTLLELVNMYESYAAMERAQIALKYDIALLEISIAGELGLLADGTNI